MRIATALVVAAVLLVVGLAVATAETVWWWVHS